MTTFTTAAFRLGVHRRDNRLRFNEERGCWQFDDGVGPWTNSANLAGLDRVQGEAVIARMGYSAE